MKFLAWDTSSRNGLVVAAEYSGTLEDKTVRESSIKIHSQWELDLSAKSAEKLLWTLHHTLESVGWTPEQLDFIGVGLGPGSFTGIRIGLTTARTFGQALNLPLVGISSLALEVKGSLPLVLSQNQIKDKPCLVVWVRNACRGEVFALMGSPEAIRSYWGGKKSEEVVEKVISPQKLVEEMESWLSKSPLGIWWLGGTEREVYRSIWKSLPQERRLVFAGESEVGFGVQGRDLVQMVLRGYYQGAAQKAIHVRPLYLRASHAEVNHNIRVDFSVSEEEGR